MLNWKSTLSGIAIAITASTTLITSIPIVVTAQAANKEAYITAENKLAVADEMTIRQLTPRLNNTLDAADYPLYASFFAKEAVLMSDFGNVNGPKKIALALEASRSLITNKRHVAANPVISGVGNQAKVTIYLVVFERAESLLYRISSQHRHPGEAQWAMGGRAP